MKFRNWLSALAWLLLIAMIYGASQRADEQAALAERATTANECSEPACDAPGSAKWTR